MIANVSHQPLKLLCFPNLSISGGFGWSQQFSGSDRSSGSVRTGGIWGLSIFLPSVFTSSTGDKYQVSVVEFVKNLTRATFHMKGQTRCLYIFLPDSVFFAPLALPRQGTMLIDG